MEHANEITGDLLASAEAARIHLQIERFENLIKQLQELADAYDHAALEFLEEFDDPRRKVTWDDLDRVAEIVAAAETTQ